MDVFILTGLRAISGRLLYCMLWLLVTSHHQKGEKIKCFYFISTDLSI